jgi:DNA-binding PadR family transcriptional regulator
MYDLKKAIEKTVGFFYSSSYGNIQPALKKLEKNKHVTVVEQIINGRNRKEYSITEKGREQFKNWLSQDINIGKIQDEGLLRLFFMTEIPKKKRIEILENYITRLKEKIVELEIVEKETKKADVPSQFQEAFNYRITTLNFGIEYYQFELNWYEKVIHKIKENQL